MAALLAASLTAPVEAQQPRREAARHAFERGLMGTVFRVVVATPDSLAAAGAAAAAFARVEALDATLSDYAPDSEVSLLARGPVRPRPVSDDLARVLERSLAWWRRSAGAFDVTVAPLSHLWRTAVRDGVPPDEAAISSALERSGSDLVTFDAVARTVSAARAGVAFDFGGIAKGFAADEALAELERAGFPSSLVDAGGDVRLGAAPPGSRGWRVSVPDVAPDGSLTDRVLELADQAVATSGDRYRYLDADGVRYSHLIDPRTGRAISERRLVSVIARDATDADALASAISVLGAEAGAELADRADVVALILVESPRGSGRWRRAR